MYSKKDKTLFPVNQFLNENFLNLPERELQSEAGEETQEEADPDLGHEHLRDLPHGVVQVVRLVEEEEEVPGHVEEVGHE